MAAVAKARRLKVSVSFLLAVFLLPLGCSKATPSKSEEMDIHEAVLRYQLQAWFARRSSADSSSNEVVTQRRPRVIVKFSVAEKDASDEFLKRFADLGNMYVPSAANANRAQESPDEPASSITFSSEHITWLSDTHVEVSGGYYCGNLCASGETFEVRKRDGKWLVVSSQMHWIS